MIRISNLKVNIEHQVNDVLAEVAKYLNINISDIKDYKIVKKSLDSRRKNRISYFYSLDIQVDNELKYLKLANVDLVQNQPYIINNISYHKRPVIVGSGPCGLFAGLILAESGLKPIILERGSSVHIRKRDVEEFWRTGILNPESNIQFGAGGAGTFSDGKLTTNTKDKRKSKFIEELIEAGAPEEIAYMAKAHIGTDILVKVVDNFDQKIKSLGGEIIYNAKFIDFTTNNNQINEVIYQCGDQQFSLFSEHLVLATGHSARDTFFLLNQKNIEMQAKAFSVGVRIEHLQSEVNQNQYGNLCTILPSAEYKGNIRTSKEKRGVYTFCMCPGGVVVAAASELGGVVTNGMSYHARSELNANSALLVNVEPSDFGGVDNPLAGVEFQRSLEARAFKYGGG
ncbi:MAG: NAD(P)/FAD-dependent oxidoreductase, partial [Erysipelotrichaceae bacterium]